MGSRTPVYSCCTKRTVPKTPYLAYFLPSHMSNTTSFQFQMDLKCAEKKTNTTFINRYSAEFKVFAITQTCFLGSKIIRLGLVDRLIEWCLTSFQLHGHCPYPYFPAILITSTPHNILSKPLAAFPHNHRRTMDSIERRMNPVAMTIINPRKDYWPTLGIELSTS